MAGGIVAIGARKPIRGTATPFFIALLLLGITSSAASSLPSWSLLEVTYTLLLALVATYGVSSALIGLSLRPERLILLTTVTPIILACLSAAIAIYASLLSNFPLRFPEPIGNYGNVRFFNQYQTWLLPFLSPAFVMPWPIPKVRQTIWRAFLFIIAVFFWALYWRSGGRGTGYATLLASLFVVLMHGRAGMRHALLMAAFAAVGYLVFIAMFPHGGGSHTHHLLSTSPNGRLYLWHIALDYIRLHPLLGIGPMQFAAIDTGLASHPHNAVLQWAAEWGLPAAVLFVSGIGYLYFKWTGIARRLVTRDDSAIPPASVVAITASLIAGGIHAMVSGVIDMPASQFMLVTVAGLAGGIALSAAPVAKANRNPGRLDCVTNIAMRAMVLFASLYVGLFTAYDYWHRQHSPKPTTAVYLRNTYQPRYWLDGTLTGMTQRPLPPRVSRRPN
ncbi:O-antigen ligase family protein [Salinisphaera hydrothermalis]|uniref:O-antigen ligase family protein n=1 Tax=Salinisphaera hydrothermalis TaxID=563188 RepID=UPI00333EF7AA